MSYAARIIRPFQSTPSGGKATGGAIIILGGVYVSIHAFRGEGDALARAAETLQLSFNPRLPGGRRPGSPPRCFRGRRFNPRLPGGRRRGSVGLNNEDGGFNPRLPGGRRRQALASLVCKRSVSIHAFRGEGDEREEAGDWVNAVSIHAFRGEGDQRTPDISST